MFGKTIYINIKNSDGRDDELILRKLKRERFVLPEK